MAEIRVNSTGGVKLYDADDSHYAQIKAGTVTSNTDVLELGSGAVVAGTKVDLNGQELILDADADTSITADTDDQIDVRIAGADDFQFTANTFTAQSGSSIVVPDGGLTFGSTAISSTAAELNIVDGNTSATGTTIADADRVVLNDNGTMVQAAVTDLKTYIGSVGLVPLQTQTASNSANVAFTSTYITSTYKTFVVMWDSVQPTSDGADLRFYISTDNGSSTLTGLSYAYTTILDSTSADTYKSSTNDEGSDYGRASFAVGDQLGESCGGTAWLRGFTDTTVYSIIDQVASQWSNARALTQTYGVFGARSTDAHNYIKFQFSTGNIDRGKFTLYGVANA